MSCCWPQGNWEDAIYFAFNSQKQEFVLMWLKYPIKITVLFYFHCLFCSWSLPFITPPVLSNFDPLWSFGIILTFAWQNIKQQICSIWVVSCNVILSNWQFPKGFRKERTIPQTPGRSDSDCQSNPCILWALISEHIKHPFSQVYFYD